MARGMGPSAVTLVLAVGSVPASGQAPDCRDYGGCTAWWVEEVGWGGANALLGGLTAGVWQELRGGSFADGFARGALGGALGYAGKAEPAWSHWNAVVFSEEFQCARSVSGTSPVASPLVFPASWFPNTAAGGYEAVLTLQDAYSLSVGPGGPEAYVLSVTMFARVR